MTARGSVVAASVLAVVVTACRPRSTTTETLDSAVANGACGPAAEAACGATEYCAYTPRLCGKGKAPGRCEAKPTSCGGAYAPVCGCDGKIYDTECAANAAGVDLAVTGGCSAKTPSWMACGAHYCDTRTSYCEIVLSDVFELPTDSTCRPLPSACVSADGGQRDCGCFPHGTRCASFCGPVDTGGLAGFHLTCRL